MSAYHHEQQTIVVATVSTPAEAIMIQTLLAAHGIHAAVSASDPAHPSLDFVTGVRITVAVDHAEEARRLLAPPQPPADDPPDPAAPSEGEGPSARR